MGKLMETLTPYVAMVSLQFGYAGMTIITKVALSKGMSHYVLVVYRQIIATIVLAPFAFFVERKIRPKLTIYIFCQIFAMGLLGPVLDQNLSYLALKITSPTYASALYNVLPAMTFVLALLLRMETLNLRKLRSGAKLVGTIVCVAGALLMTLYKGPIITIIPSQNHQSLKDSQTSTPPASAGPSNKNWVLGSLIMMGATLAWSLLFIIQASVLKKYSAPLSLATLLCFLGGLQATALSLAVVHDPAKWKIGMDMNLLTVVYSGVVASAIAYYVQGLCIRAKGPVFATSFTPLRVIIVAVMGSIILSESIYLGSVVGGVLIAIGLYAVLWGKMKDSMMSTDENFSELLPSHQVMLPKDEHKTDDIEAASKQPMNKGVEHHELNVIKQLSGN